MVGTPCGLALANQQSSSFITVPAVLIPSVQFASGWRATVTPLGVFVTVLITLGPALVRRQRRRPNAVQ
jgi:hypothetical protein